MNAPTRVMRGSRRALKRTPSGSLVQVRDARELGLGVDDHAAELEALEELAVAPDAGLAEEHRTAVLELDGDRDDDHDGRGDHAAAAWRRRSRRRA